ncbi:MAG: rRNA pseudouridine synthase [Clostridiales bacterium]|jgi:23S rRNA pseudouridine2605 synthase|nr:rRNA pseudouridine synthase [Clostridiales bacterium]
MRLQKFLSHSGLASRRKCEEVIKSKKIKVNNKIVDSMGFEIDANNDVVFYKNKLLKLEKSIYIALNKPIGFVTTVKDPFGRKCVLDLIKIKKRIFPVGRLDYNTSGLLILTNDGDFANKIIHPRNKIFKKYIVRTEKKISDKKLKMIKNGIVIDNKKTLPCKIKILSENMFHCDLEIKISEGRNRQIRKIFEKLNNKIIFLKRIAINKLEIKKLNIKISEYKFLNDMEKELLLR